MADLTSQGDPKRSCFSNGQKPHICLIGAGVSSLRCATTLLQTSSFTITILESRSRIGGRVAQSEVGKHLIDLGANWIHGTVNNPILDIAKQTGTSWEVADEDAAPVVFDSQGVRMDEEMVGKASGVFWGLIEEAMGYSEEMRDKEGEGIDKMEGLYAWLQEKVEERVDDEGLRKVVLQMSELWGNFVGMDVQKQSLRNFWMEEFGEGGNLFLDGTYKKIVDEIARPVLEGPVDVRLNTRVTKILGRDGKDRGGKVRVEVEGGERMVFDEVVVTCPLGWLKRNMQAFEPALPERFQQAVENISYGCLEKIILTFPEPFWRGEQNGHETKGMMQWLAPQYAGDKNPSNFMQFAMDYSSMTPSSSHPTLLFYISGSQSQFLIPHLSTLPDEKSRKAYLIDYCRPYFSLLNNYDAKSKACQPLDAVSTGWLLDEDAGYGSYSCFEVGLENGGEDVEVMRRGEGMVERGVWFAGEHTNLKAIGTVRGAYESGEKVAVRLREVYGL